MRKVDEKEEKRFYDILLETFFMKNKNLFSGNKAEITKRLMKKFGISKAWAYRLVERLVELGLIEES